jgi:hypothetical protein
VCREGKKQKFLEKKKRRLRARATERMKKNKQNVKKGFPAGKRNDRVMGSKKKKERTTIGQREHDREANGKEAHKEKKRNNSACELDQ